MYFNDTRSQNSPKNVVKVKRSNEVKVIKIKKFFLKTKNLNIFMIRSPIVTKFSVGYNTPKSFIFW